MQGRAAAWAVLGRIIVAGACLLWGAGSGANLAPAGDVVGGLAWMRAELDRATDDPRRVAAEAGVIADDPRLAVESRFWARLVQARVLGMLEHNADSLVALTGARELLAQAPGVGETHRLALAHVDLWTRTGTVDAAELLADAQALRLRIVAQGQESLRCLVERQLLWLWMESDALDRAWTQVAPARACEQARGGQGPAEVALEEAMLAARSPGESSAREAAQGHLQRALAVLGGRPARFLRSIIEWELAKAIRGPDPQTALKHLERSAGYSRAIGDEVGAALVDIERSAVLLDLKQDARALALARSARLTLLAQGATPRVPGTYLLSLEALLRMDGRDLATELAEAHRNDHAAAGPRVRSRLAARMASAHARLGQHEQAYHEVRRAWELERSVRNDESNHRLQRLQSAYESAQRDAENQRLRLVEETTRLELQAARARQHGLLAMLAALAVVALGLGLWGARVWQQRRLLVDLALRDELTGLPNRRAVLALAQSQWAHGRRIGIPLTVAVLDLDHFKLVNDTWGHDAGDRLLQAFAQGAGSVLRSQDRLGRLGGEEWLLVAPGARPEDLQALFERWQAAFAACPVAGLPRPHGQTFSMGVAADGPGVADLAALVAQADARLYRAKSRGRNQACLSD